MEIWKHLPGVMKSLRGHSFAKRAFQVFWLARQPILLKVSGEGQRTAPRNGPNLLLEPEHDWKIAPSTPRRSNIPGLTGRVLRRPVAPLSKRIWRMISVLWVHSCWQPSPPFQNHFCSHFGAHGCSKALEKHTYFILFSQKPHVQQSKNCTDAQTCSVCVFSKTQHWLKMNPLYFFFRNLEKLASSETTLSSGTAHQPPASILVCSARVNSRWMNQTIQTNFFSLNIVSLIIWWN